MGKLVSVVESSMGPRREPMTFISTTAGINQTGPFIDKLAGIHKLLEKELAPDAEHTISEDRQACLLLDPEEREQQDEELLLTSKDVRRKVNPMLGIIVQHSFYDDEIAKARQNPEKMNEVVCKLFNTYKGGRVKDWLTTASTATGGWCSVVSTSQKATTSMVCRISPTTPRRVSSLPTWTRT